MINWTALIVFVVLFVLCHLASGSSPRTGARATLAMLHEWGLGGRRFGTWVTWFLIGGDLYTAYTFIAVPALMFGAGAIGFFAVPYTIMVYPIALPGVPAPVVGGAQARLRHLGRLRARPLRQSLAGAGHRLHRHRRDHAVYRAAACRHPGGDRRHGDRDQRVWSATCR